MLSTAWASASSLEHLLSVHLTTCKHTIKMFEIHASFQSLIRVNFVQISQMPAFSNEVCMYAFENKWFGLLQFGATDAIEWGKETKSQQKKMKIAGRLELEQLYSQWSYAELLKIWKKKYTFLLEFIRILRICTMARAPNLLWQTFY